jgi:adenine-specific DNA-methyltransferase
MNWQKDIRILKPRKALNKAFLKVKPKRAEMESFKTHLSQLLDRINENESEEFHKNLVIHNSNNASGTVGVIIEAKKPANKAEMLSKDKMNLKEKSTN